jgi:pimeloyl-ACP methyl ester carboxylesterase
LTIIAQAADYLISPHPFIWILHELFVRLPVEYFLPASFLRNTVVGYIMARDKENDTQPALPRHLIEEQFHKISLWPFVYKFSVLPVIHYFDMRKQLDGLTMPVLLINRADDRLSPEVKTAWLAKNLPNCAGYHIIPGGERFFMYSQAENVNRIIAEFLTSHNTYKEANTRVVEASSEQAGT